MSTKKESLNEKVVNDHNMTPKSQKQMPYDVKRWASVVKAQKKQQISTEINKASSEVAEGSSEVLDCKLKTFPKWLEDHKGFFCINDKIFFCNICSMNLDSVLTLSHHLKTRKHEDSAIEYFKTKMPMHLHNSMEFVSFYGSNLCCNLCQYKIAMSSQNPHETILNIIAHNSNESHISKKLNHETFSGADSILKSLASSYPIIMQNINFIERKMVPEFKCKLCNKSILYDDNLQNLSQNFSSHMKSVGHIKNKEAVAVLKLFGEASLSAKDNWTVVNGNVMCNYCNLQFEPNLQHLISHMNDVEHATNIFLKLGISSSIGKVSENSTLQDNMMNEVKHFALNKPKKDSDEELSLKLTSEIKSKPGCRLRELLNTMPTDLKKVDYVIENEKGSITCLICNRVVPPSTYNLKTHLLGIKHKNNMELIKTVGEESHKTLPVPSAKKPDNEGTNNDHCNTLNSSEVQKLRSLIKKVGYTVSYENGLLTCTICQQKIPNPTLVHEHIASVEHKNREVMWSKNCPGCTSENPFIVRILEVLPKSIRLLKCRKMETIPASVLAHLFSLLLKENQLVKKNENILVKNVDGKNSFCKLCKSLIPLSLDLDILEKNLTSHLNEKRHENLFSKCENRNIEDVSSSTTKVARSLFEIPDEFRKLKKDAKAFNFEDFTSLIFKDLSTNTELDGKQLVTSKVSRADTSLYVQNREEIQSRSLENEKRDSSGEDKQKNGEVFIFGKGEKRQLCLDNLKEINAASENLSKKGVLPIVNVSRHFKFEEETDEEVLIRRQKQIDYGKNTDGYARYCQLIPRRKRGTYDPVTPPKHLRCSRRTWDGMIRAWRRQLHAWDPPVSKLDSDIQPLE